MKSLLNWMLCAFISATLSLNSAPIDSEEPNNPKYLRLAQHIVASNGINIARVFQKPISFQTDTRDWIKGMTLIVAGALLCRYPPPVRSLGISMIKAGVAFIGWEYYDEIMDYLIDHKILRKKIEL